MKKEQIINLTPHNVVIVDEEGTVIKTFQASGSVLRCSQKTVEIGTVAGIKLTQTSFGKVENLPSYKDGVFYITSRLAKSACPNRDDLLTPNEMIRNEDGQIIGCRSLSI